MIDAAHAYHDRLEGASYDNDCADDRGCFAGGCGGEVCSAEKDAISTCELLAIEWPPQSSCGCVQGSCRWWNPTGTMLEDRPAPRHPREPEPRAGRERCGNQTCKPGETCIVYHGIAGPSGPAFQECGIRCRPGPRGGACPSGMRCVVIADGPGAVCR